MLQLLFLSGASCVSIVNELEVVDCVVSLLSQLFFVVH